MQTSNKEGKKVLLRVSNLKQYFPLKKKGLFVKANDGITLDIYEGETFGLVGESGCGKSTLGRTLLQLYRQTDGRTMYYGRTLDDLAPAYVKKTLQTLDKRREKWHELKKHLANVQKEYDALPDGEAKYKKHKCTAGLPARCAAAADKSADRPNRRPALPADGPAQKNRRVGIPHFQRPRKGNEPPRGGAARSGRRAL